MKLLLSNKVTFILTYLIAKHVICLLPHQDNLVLKIDVYDKDLPYTDNDFVDFLRVTVPIQGGEQRFFAHGTRQHDRTR